MCKYFIPFSHVLHHLPDCNHRLIYSRILIFTSISSFSPLFFFPLLSPCIIFTWFMQCLSSVDHSPLEFQLEKKNYVFFLSSFAEQTNKIITVSWPPDYPFTVPVHMHRWMPLCLYLASLYHQHEEEKQHRNNHNPQIKHTYLGSPSM